MSSSTAPANLRGEFAAASLKQYTENYHVDGRAVSPRRIRRGLIEALPSQAIRPCGSYLRGEFAAASLKHQHEDMIMQPKFWISAANSPRPH